MTGRGGCQKRRCKEEMQGVGHPGRMVMTPQPHSLLSSYLLSYSGLLVKRHKFEDFPGGPVVNPPANTGDPGPNLERFHMLQDN